MSRMSVPCLKTFSVATLVIAVVWLTGCSVTRSRASDYFDRCPSKGTSRGHRTDSASDPKRERGEHTVVTLARP